MNTDLFSSILQIDQTPFPKTFQSLFPHLFYGEDYCLWKALWFCPFDQNKLVPATGIAGKGRGVYFPWGRPCFEGRCAHIN